MKNILDFVHRYLLKSMNTPIFLSVTQKEISARGIRIVRRLANYFLFN